MGKEQAAAHVDFDRVHDVYNLLILPGLWVYQLHELESAGMMVRSRCARQIVVGRQPGH
jgi:hypothetical protein